MRNPNHEPHSPQQQAILEAAESLQGKSRTELLGELKAAAAQQQSAGMLNHEQMDDVFNTIAPFLNDAQRQKMTQIFAELKR